MRRNPRARGSALLLVLIVTALVLFSVAGLLYFVQVERQRASFNARAVTRSGCAEAGLQLARTYFAQNFGSWNSYLATPSQYNPVPSTWNTTPADPKSPALRAARPELFYDLDGDNQPDVYIYIRDNADELPPAAPNWARDNDQNAFVGAVCISSTMNTRRPDGTLSPDQLTSEGLLSYNGAGKGYCSQGFGGGNGTGNLNGCN